MKSKVKEKGKKKNFLRNIGIGHDRDYLIENLSVLIASGMPIIEALDSVKKDIRVKAMREIVDEIKTDVEAGFPLWKAIKNAGIFPEHTISLMRIGEDSGKLSANLKIISLQEQKQRMFRSKIRSAMMYPVFVLTLTLIIGIGIAWFILPKLATVFSQLKLELPFITKVLIETGKFLGEYGFIVVPIGIFLIVLILYFTFYFPKTKFIGQSILFFIPGVKRLIQEIEISRFGYLLGTLLEAGLPITEAINSLSKATQFPHYKRFYENLEINIDAGNSFERSFNEYHKLSKLIPNPIQQLVIVGEKSGNLSKSLISISETFEEKTETTTKNLTIILEPILLVIVWLGVVGVALAVILPIYNLIGGLNNKGAQTQKTNTTNPVTEEVSEITEPQESLDNIANTNSTSTEETIAPKINKLEITQTGIGYLNVRSTPSTSGEIVSKVYPEESFEYVTEENGWYQIVLKDGAKGWIINTYAKVIENE